MKVWRFYYSLRWRILERYGKLRKRFYFRLRRVQCALNDHLWKYDRPPKYATKEWREMQPYALVGVTCQRCKETKFDRLPGHRGFGSSFR